MQDGLVYRPFSIIQRHPVAPSLAIHVITREVSDWLKVVARNHMAPILAYHKQALETSFPAAVPGLLIL